MSYFSEDAIPLAQRIIEDYKQDASRPPALRRGRTDELVLAEAVVDFAMRVMRQAELRALETRSASEAPCATCNDDPAECAKVPGLRHCEKANRETPSASESGTGLTAHEASVIAAAVHLAPLLDEGWDDQDTPEDRNEGAKACDALVDAVKAYLATADSHNQKEAL